MCRVLSSRCLTDETMLGFLEGRLSEDEIAGVEFHVLRCESCQELISGGIAARSGGQGVWEEGGDAMAAPELSCRFLQPLLGLAAKEVPAGEVFLFLDSWRTTATALSDESGWVTLRFCEALVEWLAGRVGIRAIIDRTLKDSYSPKTMGLLYPFIRAFGSPRAGYARLPSFVNLLNRANDVEVSMRGRNRATIAYRPRTEETRERSPLICQVRRAQIAAGPTIWNLPLAIVEEAECQALGGDRCVYQVRWMEPTRWWQSLLGGTVLAAVAWLSSAHNWMVSALTMTTSVVGVHLWGARRDLRQLRVLEDLKMSMLGQVRRLGPDGAPSGPAARVDAAPPSGPVAAPLPQPGQLLASRYRLGPLLGAGGTGFVFSASDEATKHQVALKVLRPELSVNPRWVERMEREVRIARTIRDPHVCRVLSFGQVDGYCFLTMELATGSLYNELRRQAVPKPWEARIADVKAIVLGLVAIHRAGIVHRDLTPQNIVRLSGRRLAITDFGLAIDQPWKTTQVAGTPRYIAPEVLRGARVSYASDVWQLGMIMHEVLYDRRPVSGGECDGVAPSSSSGEAAGGARALAALCMACVHEDPGQRPQNAQAVARRFPSLDAG
jgi:serine/threonine-protein kinase